MRARTLSPLVAVAVVVAALFASPASAEVAYAELLLNDGRPAFVLGEELFLPDANGVLGLAGTARFDLAGGRSVSTQSGKILGGRTARLFAPQPEPPGRLLARLMSGEQVQLRGGSLQILLPDGSLRQLANGTFKIAGGGTAIVRGGRLKSLSSLAGFHVPAADDQRGTR